MRGRRKRKLVDAGQESPLDFAVQSRDRNTLAMVREALDRGDTVLAYQPVVSARQPDRIAVTQIGKRRKLSYRALETRANHLARQLRDLGVEPGDVVGLAARRDQ